MGPHTAVVLEGVLKAVHWVHHGGIPSTPSGSGPENGLLGEELAEAGPSLLY